MSKTQSKTADLTCKDWYDFMGQFAEGLPYIHLGGFKATRDLLEICHIDEQTQILDVGCGPGTTACMIAQEYESQIVGVDFSEQMIVKAEDKALKLGLKSNIRFQVADATELPFGDGRFDVVIFESVLTAIDDKISAMKEAYRVVKTGGIIAANETIFDSSLTPEFLELLDEYPSINGHLTEESLKALFEEVNLEVSRMNVVLGSEVPSSKGDLGLRKTLAFVFRSFGKIMRKVITDSRYRRVQHIDREINRELKENGGYAIIAGRKLD
jgi:ubiquinone/menaquinone biosynthesis C-methylase UbiE